MLEDRCEEKGGKQCLWQVFRDYLTFCIFIPMFEVFLLLPISKKDGIIFFLFIRVLFVIRLS